MSGDVASLARVLALPALDGLNVRQIRVLMHLMDGPATTAEIAASLDLIAGHVSAVGAALTLSGLCERDAGKWRLTFLGSDVADRIGAALRPLAPAATEEV